MNTFNNDPNFSIVMPGGCNANCKFCFNKDTNKKTSEPIQTWIKILHDILIKLPEHFYQISITGGEPLLSPNLEALSYVFQLSGLKDKYTNILLTTNGTGLIEKIDTVSSFVDHVNVSRHHYDEDENRKIFGGSYCVTDEYLRESIDEYGKRGIDVSVNCVINDKTTKAFILSFIDWSKTIGFHAIRFRKENGNLEQTPVEKEFSEYKNLWHGACPVCRTALQRIRGVDVFWKSSTLEPSETITDSIFELVYESDAYIYLDWKREKKLIDVFHVSMQKQKPSEKSTNQKKQIREHANSGSCGGFVTDNCGNVVTGRCGNPKSRC